METQFKPSRAEQMAKTYESILIKAGVMQPRTQPKDSLAEMKSKLASGEISLWQVTLGQIGHR